MNEKIISNASEARGLTDKKKPTIDRVLMNIANQAELGNSHCIMIGFDVDDSILIDLVNRGFKVERFEDPLRNPCIKISW